MFTGIIHSTGVISNIANNRVSIAVNPSFDMRDVAIGDSIAADGVCLTVTEKRKDIFTAAVLKETLRLTTLGTAKNGTKVNLEKALKPSDRIGGHIVTGHVDGFGIIKRKGIKDGSQVMEFNLQDELARQVVKKGSIAVDGISLTVAEINDNGYTVHLIPHTLKLTTLGFKNIGDKVNIETDIIGKYAERFLPPYTEIKGSRGEKHAFHGQGSSNLDMDFLAKHGFINED